MQVFAAGTGVFLSDGSTNVLPVGDQMHHGWGTYYDLVHRSCATASTRAGTCTRAAGHAVCRGVRRVPRVRAGRGPPLADYAWSRGGPVLDEPATARGLAASFARALDNGAADAAEIRE